MKEELCAFSPSQDERLAPRHGSLGCVSVGTTDVLAAPHS